NASGSGLVDDTKSSYGVYVAAAQNVTVGGPNATDRNVVSGHSIYGVVLDGLGTSNNVVAGNFIGTDLSGGAAVGNQFAGVQIGFGGTNNTVGGTTAVPGTGLGNVISGGNRNGVHITDTTATANTVAGNLIGTKAGGLAALGNIADGVRIDLGSGNTIGGIT